MFKNVSFYGPSKGPLTPQTQRQYAPAMQMAQQLMQAGGSMAPVQSPLEGVARALQGGLGGYMNYATMKARKDREAAQSESMMKMISAMQGQTMPTYEGVSPESEQAKMLAEQDAGLFTEADPYKVGSIADALAAYDGHPDNQHMVMNLQMQKMAQEQAARQLADTRAYSQEQELLKHQRNLETEKMKRRLRLQDASSELQERDRLARARDAAKPYILAGLPPPTVGAQAPQAGGGPATPPVSLAEAQAQKARMIAEATATGKAEGEAKAELPMIEHNSKYLLGALDAILAPKIDERGNPIVVDGRYAPGVEHPGLEASVGVKSGGAIFDNLPYIGGVIGGTDAADFTAKLEQVTGKQFLQAFETLKGGGQITEIEGTKATQALANLSTAQTEKQFRESLLQFRYEVEELTKIAKQRAGVGSSLKSKYGLE